MPAPDPVRKALFPLPSALLTRPHKLLLAPFSATPRLSSSFRGNKRQLDRLCLRLLTACRAESGSNPKVLERRLSGETAVHQLDIVEWYLKRMAQIFFLLEGGFRDNPVMVKDGIVTDAVVEAL